MTRRVVLAATCCCAALAWAVPARRIAGSGDGGHSVYATDAYPGFDGLDDLPKAEKKETSWFLWTSRDTPAAQLAYAKEMLAEGSIRAARRACDALVREWPVAPEAHEAQLLLAEIWGEKEDDWQEAFDALSYLLDFYPREVPYAQIVERMYKVANLLVDTRTTFWGLSLRSLRVLRQNYEIVVRLAPGADYVPDALMRIADLRERDDQYEEAAEVYSSILNRFPKTPQAHDALWRGAAARMWTTRRLAYNRPRCLETLSYLKMAIAEEPEHEKADEMKQWIGEIADYLAKEAYAQAKFYDSKQRTPHAALVAWRNFLAEYPDSTHADEIRARIDVLRAAAPQTDDDGEANKAEQKKENGK